MPKNYKIEFDMLDASCLPKGQCIPQETSIRNVRLAAAYVPYQKMCAIFSPIEGLRHGTIFPELFSPYEGRDKKCRSISEE